MKKCIIACKPLLALLLLSGLLACQPAVTTKPADSAEIGLAPGSTGNPPLIPHEVEATDDGDVCIGCHQTGENGAPKYPVWHAELVNCRQCHVPASGSAEPFKTSY